MSLSWPRSCICKRPWDEMLRSLNDTGMLDRDAMALSQNLRAYQNLALAGSEQATEINRVPKLNGFEARRRLVGPTLATTGCATSCAPGCASDRTVLAM